MIASDDEGVPGGSVLWAQDRNEHGAFLRISAEDSDFIVHARDDIRWMLAEIERLKAVNGQAIGLIEMTAKELASIIKANQPGSTQSTAAIEELIRRFRELRAKFKHQ